MQQNLKRKKSAGKEMLTVQSNLRITLHIVCLCCLSKILEVHKHVFRCTKGHQLGCRESHLTFVLLYTGEPLYTMSYEIVYGTVLHQQAERISGARRPGGDGDCCSTIHYASKTLEQPPLRQQKVFVP